MAFGAPLTPWGLKWWKLWVTTVAPEASAAWSMALVTWPRSARAAASQPLNSARR